MSVSAVTKAGSSQFHGTLLRLHPRQQVRRRTTARTRIAGVEKPKSKYQLSRRQHRRSDPACPASTSSATRRSSSSASRCSASRSTRARASASCRRSSSAHGDFSEFADQQRQQPRSAGRQRASFRPGFARTPARPPRATTSRPTSPRSAACWPTPTRCRTYNDANNRYNYVYSRLEPTNRTDLKMRFDYNISQQHEGLRPRRHRGRGRRERAAACGGARRTSRCRRRTSARTAAGRYSGNIVVGAQPDDDQRSAGVVQPPDGWTTRIRIRRR